MFLEDIHFIKQRHSASSIRSRFTMSHLINLSKELVEYNVAV